MEVHRLMQRRPAAWSLSPIGEWPKRGKPTASTASRSPSPPIPPSRCQPPQRKQSQRPGLYPVGSGFRLIRLSGPSDGNVPVLGMLKVTVQSRKDGKQETVSASSSDGSVGFATTVDGSAGFVIDVEGCRGKPRHPDDQLVRRAGPHAIRDVDLIPDLRTIRRSIEHNRLRNRVIVKAIEPASAVRRCCGRLP